MILQVCLFRDGVGVLLAQGLTVQPPCWPEFEPKASHRCSDCCGARQFEVSSGGEVSKLLGRYVFSARATMFFLQKNLMLPGL